MHQLAADARGFHGESGTRGNHEQLDDKLTTFAHVCPCCLANTRCTTPECDVPARRDFDKCAVLDAKDWAELARLARMNKGES